MWWTSVLFVCLATICSSCGDSTLIFCPPSSSLSLYDRDRDNSTPVLQVKCVIQAWPITPRHFSGQRDFLGDSYMTQEDKVRTISRTFVELLWRENHSFFLPLLNRMGMNLRLLEATTRSLRIKPLLKEGLRHGGKKIDGIRASGSIYARSNCLDFNIFTFMFSLSFSFFLPSNY